MGFWSGFEGLTGHRPGAFKGFSLKDILDKDMWERRERLNQGRRLEETGVKDTTAIYKGMAKPGLFGDVVGKPYGGAAGVTPVNPASRVPFTRRQGGFTGPRSTREYPIVPSDRISHDYARTSPARPWANLQPENLLTPSWAGSAASADRDVGMGANRFLQLGDPRNIRSGPDLPPASGFRSPATGMVTQGSQEGAFGDWWRNLSPAMADKKTVKKIFADPNKSDEIIETIEEKVPTGSAQWGNVQHPPNWQQRFDRRPVTFSSPTRPEGALSIMNMNRGLTSVPEDEIRRLMRELQGMKARRGY